MSLQHSENSSRSSSKMSVYSFPILTCLIRFCLGRVMRRGEEVLAMAIQGLKVDGRRSRGTAKLTWEQVITCGIEGTLTNDGRAWKATVHPPEPATGEIMALS